MADPGGVTRAVWRLAPPAQEGWSNVSSLPEVAGDAAVLVDPRDPRAIADGLRRVLTEPGLRETLRARGLARAAEFSWDRSIRRIRQIYGEVAAEP